MSSSLQQAIEGIYIAFREVPRPIPAEGGPPCLGRSGIAALLSKPLRDLSSEDLHLLNSQPLVHGGLANPFWEEAPEGQKQVTEWLRSAETQKAIQAEYGVRRPAG